MFKISNKTFAVLASLLYAGFVSLIASQHVVWRDEVVPMTQVAQSSSLADLYLKVHNFGHPFLWYFLLYMVHQVIHPFWAIKILNISICVAAIYIFLVNSPFSRIQKILFILGFFPLYLYPIFNRNYGISMLLLFAFASLYPKRFERIIPLGCVLFLLANAHAHSLITTIGIFMALTAEFIFCAQSRRSWQEHLNKTVVGFSLIVGGIVWSIVQILPEHTNIVYHPHSLSIHEIISAFIKAIVLPGKTFIGVMGVPNPLVTTLVIFGMYLYLIAKPYLFVLFGCTVIGLSIFYHLIFQSDDFRHQGAFYLLFITIFWLDHYVQEVRLGKALAKYRDVILPFKGSFFIFLLILQVCMACPALIGEVTSLNSSSKGLTDMLKSSAQFKDAILIGEPGSMLESIPYYAQNTLYLPREGSFRKYTIYSTDQKPQYSLTELLDVAKRMKAQTGKTVLIVLHHKLTPEGPFIFEFSHNRSFTYTKESLDEFDSQTRRIAKFNEAVGSDENYSVYYVK